jgi:hypothetical protein
MGYQFEVFKRTVRARPRDIVIVVYRTGNIRLSRPAHEALVYANLVDLLFVPGQRVFGLRASDGPDAYVITASLTISARSFLTENNLIPDEASRRYGACLQDGILVFVA